MALILVKMIPHPLEKQELNWDSAHFLLKELYVRIVDLPNLILNQLMNVVKQRDIVTIVDFMEE